MAGNRIAGEISHVGLIPDGGRRWAARNEIPLVDSYMISMGKLGRCLEAFYAHGIGSVSVYMLSKANLARTPAELHAVDCAESSFLEDVVPPLRDRWSITVRVAGDLDPVPGRLREAATKVHSAAPKLARALFLCIGYDPFDELLAALKNGSSLKTKDELLARLWVPQELDLVIRTGGAATLSRFLPLQAGYAQLVLLDKLFNDIAVEEFLEIIDEQRQRTFLFGT